MTDASPKIQILIVDDSRLTRVSLKTSILQLAAETMTVIGEAEEGRTAVELAEQLNPDIILMDIGMPMMDGITATQTIRKRRPEARIIMLTSHEEEKDVLDAFQSGATSYCLKDTTPEILVQAIRMTASGACWIDPRIARIVVSRLQPSTPASGPQEEPSTFSLLTEREVEVLKLLAEGQNNTQISETLCISMNTVKTHLKNIFQKLEVEDRTAAALKALKERII